MRRRYRRASKMMRRRRYSRVGGRNSKVEVKFVDAVIPMQQVNTYFEDQATPTATLQGQHNYMSNIFKAFYSGTNFNAAVGSSVYIKKISFKVFGYLCPQGGSGAGALTSLNSAIFRFIVHNGNVTSGSSISNFFFPTSGQTWPTKPINRKLISVFLDKQFVVTSPVSVSKATSTYRFGDGRCFYKYYTLNVNRQVKFASLTTAGSSQPRNDSDIYSVAMLADAPYWSDTTGGLSKPSSVATFCASCAIRVYYTDD